MNRLSRIALALLGILAGCNEAYANVGRTPGTFTVSQTGEATYTIPIWTPPGPRGLQPQIALVYNSHSGAGIMGPGWSIAGLSSITRCGRTFAQDATPAPVTLTYGDAFCLDGQRLRLYGSETLSTYGQDGTTYQTEVADFSLVTAHGTAGNGPASFTVQGKNGLTYEYGVIGNSQVLGGSTAMAWMLDKVTDRAGNTLVISYEAPSATLSGATIPQSISWTPTSHGAGTYNYTLTFDYSTSNTPASSIFGYVAGNPVVNQDLLLDINITNASTAIIKKYFLSYDTSPSTGATRLSTVKECADNGANCLLPTVIGYQDGAAGVSASAAAAVSSAATVFLRTHYDLNGDGYSDLVYSDGANVYVALGSASGYGAGVLVSGITFAQATRGTLGDVLGTGTDGMLAMNGSTCYYYYGWSGTAFSNSAPISGATSCGFLVDVNGDGLPDFVTSTTTTVLGDKQFHTQVRLNTSTNGVVSFGAPTDTLIEDCVSCTFILDTPDGDAASSLRSWDFDGDGRQDLAERTTYQNGSQVVSQWHLLMANGANFTPVAVGPRANSNPGPTFVNWNNDACTDFIWGTVLQVAGCNGSAPLSLTVPPNIFTAMDWDGDGRTDIVVDNAGTLGIYLSTGNGVAPLQTTTMSDAGGCVYFAFDANGDGLEDLGCWTPLSGAVSYQVHNGSGTPADLVNSIKDGYLNSINLTYTSIVQNSYTNSSDATQGSGYRNYVGPLYVVNQAVFSDPSSTSGGTYTQQFSYVGGWMSLQGRGFTGFQQTNTHDSRTGLNDIQYYERSFPFTGMKYQDFIWNGSFYISQSVFTPVDISTATVDDTPYNQRYFPYFQNQTVTSREVGGTENGQLITTRSTNYTYDQYGNATNVATTVTDNDPNSPYAGQQWTTTTATTTAADASSNWCLTLATEVQVTNTAPGSSITRTATFGTPLDYVNCRPISKTVEPNSPYYALTDSYGYDQFGNLSDVTVSGVGVSSRNTHTDWGATGQFPMAVTNALGQTTTYNYDFNLAFKTLQQDANGVSTTWIDDNFGRKASESRPDGTSTVWEYADCTPCLTGPHGLAVTEIVYGKGGFEETDGETFTDQLERPLVSNKRILTANVYVRHEVRYDSLGRVVRRAIPCTWSAYNAPCPDPDWTTISYDVLNRVTQVQRPISASNQSLQTTTFQYAGRTVTTIDPQQKRSIKIMTVAGTMGRSQDHDGYYQSFTYDAFGSLVSVTDSLSNPLFAAGYDYGVGAFQRDATDMDLDVSTAAGQHRHYSYDALGELTNWSDAKGQNFTESYDALSRPLVRTEPDLTTTWTWGTGTINSQPAYNIGRLQSVAANSYSESYTYDTLGRLASQSVTIPSDGTYEYDWSYDPTFGHVGTLTYPASTSSYRLKLQYGYRNGFLQSVADSNTGMVYWQANATNVRNQITQETLGNGVVTNRNFDAVTGWMGSITSGVNGATDLQNESYLFDEVGNLTQRQNNNTSMTENFYPDDLYRLDHSTLGSNVNLQMHYDASGNITARSDLVDGATWTYDPNRRHAVTQAGSSAYSYTYDANGNVATRNGLAISWTSYNHPLVINSPGESVQFAYKQDHTRWSAIYNGSTGIETTYFVGDLLEKVITAGVSDYRHFIYADGTKVAIYSRTSTGTNSLHYVREDHLGGVSGILNSDGTSYVKESFTAFGARRSSCTWSGPPTQGNLQAINAVTRHGFTWQTALGSMGLNDMNGRIEDAITGRFLSPDPTVPNVGFTQSFNRYSYVDNNPLSQVDPSGFGGEDPAMEHAYDAPAGGEDAGDGGGDYGGDALGEVTVTGSRDNGSQTVGDVPPSTCYAGGCWSPTQVCVTGSGCDTSYHWSSNGDASGLGPIAPLTSGPSGGELGDHGKGALASRAPSSGPAAPSEQPRGRGGVLAVGAVSIPWSEIGTIGGRALLAQIAAAASAAALVLAPSTTASQDDDSGQIFYHGTATFGGGPLDAQAAAANGNNFGSAPGFYLATDPDTAAHFANVAAEQSGGSPVVLQYYVTNTALKGLQEAGSVLGPIPGGPTRFMSFPGQQLFVPVPAFPAFNGYLATGRINLMGSGGP